MGCRLRSPTTRVTLVRRTDHALPWDHVVGLDVDETALMIVRQHVGMSTITSPRTRILVVDDDPAIVFGLRTALEADGYDVVTAADGAEGLAAVARTDPEVVVLDVSMPGLDGLAVCRTLRAQGDRVPVLVLTALDHPRDRVEGLDAGADDYLGKPFDLDELLARVRALARRASPIPREVVGFGDRTLHPDDRVLTSPRGTVALTRIETAILTVFFSSPSRVRTRDDLVDAVWADDEAPRSNALEVYISSLRRKLDEAGEGRLIETVRGVGYRIGAGR